MPNEIAKFSGPANLTQSLAGTNALDDYLFIDREPSRSTYSDYVAITALQNADKSIGIRILDVKSGLTQNLTLPALGSANAIETVQQATSGNAAYSGNYRMVVAGDYSTASENLSIIGTLGDDVSIGPQSGTFVSSLTGGAGNDRLTGGTFGNVLQGGSGQNIIVARGSDSNYVRAFTADGGTDTITYSMPSAGTNLLQLTMPNATVRNWNFERKGNDLTGFVTDSNNSTYTFTIKDHYAGMPVKQILVYGIGYTNPNSGNAVSVGMDWTDAVSSSRSWLATAGSSAADQINLNAYAQRPGYYVFSNAGNDQIVARAGTPIYVLAGEGVDTVVYPGTASQYKVSITSSSRKSVTTPDSNTDTLILTERVKFADKTIAYDLAITESTGQAVALIGAVLGKDLLPLKKDLMTAVVGLFDQGISLPVLSGAVMRLPIWGGVLTPTNSSSDIASYLLTRVKGRAPTADELQAAVRAIDTQTQGQFLADLAASADNLKQVDLVGLAATGFDLGP